MEELVIINDAGNSIDLKYDGKKYNIEYVKSKRIIILRRLADNRTLEIFSDKIGFIVQYNSEEQTNFLVTAPSENGVIEFKHYVDSGYGDSLQLKNSFEGGNKILVLRRITDSSYIVDQSNGTSRLYNLNETSKRFGRIYTDPRVRRFFNDKTVLVSETVYSDYRRDIYDTLTYGVSLETFEITTPIWSELQQRFINVYNKEQVDKLVNEKGLRFDGISLDEITISYEIKRYLNEIAKQFGEPQSVYTGLMSEEVNKEFVMKFVRNCDKK